MSHIVVVFLRLSDLIGWLLLRLIRVLIVDVVGDVASGGHLGDVGLSFSLVTNLVVDVRIFPCYFLVINQEGYFTFPIPQLISLHFHLLLCSHCLTYSLILNQHISSLSG